MNEDSNEAPLWVLQVCHGYSGPFLDCARQYAVLFKDTPYKVCTVFLTGKADDAVAHAVASDEVIFLEQSRRQIRGLKWRAILRLRALVARRHVHFCIAHRAKSIYVTLLATSLPVFGVIHAFGVYSRRSRQWFANLFHSRLTLLTVSDAVRDDVRAALSTWPAQQIKTCYNRVDVDAIQATLLSRSAARQALALPENAWIVGNVGRLHPDKDQATLIRGFAMAQPLLPPRSLLVIVGSGRLEAELKQLSQSLKVAEQVRFLGQVPAANRYFKAFDLFVLSSDHEPFGMVLLEAMAAEVPVLTTDCGGAPEVMGETGRYFTLHAADELAEQLVNSAEDGTSWSVGALSRLQQQFSDVAATAHFFQLPAVRALIKTDSVPQ